jgi:hypothetical protein
MMLANPSPIAEHCETMSQKFNGEAQRYVGREGAYETHVRAQPSSTPLRQRLNVVMTRWRGLIQIARNPYRPELHYMRGPGPKWYAKHQGRTETARPNRGGLPLNSQPLCLF